MSREYMRIDIREYNLPNKIFSNISHLIRRREMDVHLSSQML